MANVPYYVNTVLRLRIKCCVLWCCTDFSNNKGIKNLSSSSPCVVHNHKAFKAVIFSISRTACIQPCTIMVHRSTDSQLKLWNLKKPHCLRTFRGHSNEKNFVGLATDGDYVACGEWKLKIFLTLRMRLCSMTVECGNVTFFSRFSFIWQLACTAISCLVKRNCEIIHFQSCCKSLASEQFCPAGLMAVVLVCDQEVRTTPFTSTTRASPSRYWRTSLTL